MNKVKRSLKKLYNVLLGILFLFTYTFSIIIIASRIKFSQNFFALTKLACSYVKNNSRFSNKYFQFSEKSTKNFILRPYFLFLHKIILFFL